MLTPDMKRIIEEQRLGFVATASLDGMPNVSPKGTFAVPSADQRVSERHGCLTIVSTLCFAQPGGNNESFGSPGKNLIV